MFGQIALLVAGKNSACFQGMNNACLGSDYELFCRSVGGKLQHLARAEQFV
jgi:hypothetical protein